MTKQQRNTRLPILSAACSLVIAAFAAMAGGAGQTSTETTTLRTEGKNAVIRAGNQSTAAFNLTDYYRWRESVAPMPDAAGEAAPVVNSANADNDTGNDFRLHLPDMGDLRALAADAVNTNDNAFARWRQKAQLELFSSVEDELARRGEEALLLNFTTLKRSHIDLQSRLGGRKAHVGANLIGAIDEQQNSALGWQLRVYGAQESSKGFNAGIFYRHINGDMLIGGNLFADYEDHEVGSFIRYSIGGDLQHKFVHLAANYYIPTTDEKATDTGGMVFSRQGYDARVRIVIPQTHVRAALDYYNFSGDRGFFEQKGIRYGAEVYHFPLTGLRFGMFYDGEAQQLGTELAYTHTFGEAKPKAPLDNGIPPLDLFAPVDREHTQRILAPPSPLTAALAYDNRSNLPTFSNNASVHIIATIVASGGAGYRWSLISRGIGFGLIIARDIPDNAGREFRYQCHRNDSCRRGRVLTATVVIDDHSDYTTAAYTLFFTATATLAAGTSEPEPDDVTTTVTTMMTMTTETAMTTQSRVARVLFTVGLDTAVGFVVATSRAKMQVTLPPATTPRPWVLTDTRDFQAEFASRQSGQFIQAPPQSGVTPGTNYTFGDARTGIKTITIVQGSEDFVEPPVSTTITTRTTTAITSTMIADADAGEINPNANIPPLPIMAMADSRFRGNDERNTPPNFPHKRADIVAATYSARAFFPTG